MNTTTDQDRSLATATITRSAASGLIAAAREAVDRIGIEVAVAVTDGAGNLKAFECTDRAPFLTGDVAIGKAWTAASYGIPTHAWNAYLAGDPKVAHLANIPRLMPVAGGYSLKEAGALIGAIGVSGGTYQQDQNIAEAALERHWCTDLVIGQVCPSSPVDQFRRAVSGLAVWIMRLSTATAMATSPC